WVFSRAKLERKNVFADSRLDKLDGSGRLEVPFHLNAEQLGGPVRHVLEATVTDVDRQVSTGTLARVVHPASFYVGLKAPASGVRDAHEVLDVRVVAVTTAGVPRLGASIAVSLDELEGHSSTRLLQGDDGWPSSETDVRQVVRHVTTCSVVSEVKP